jgi:hypothetical protein
MDYGQGTLTIKAPAAQGISGNLRSMGESKLSDMTLQSDLELGHIVLVSLDEKPIRSSLRMLLQVMSEEQNSGWKTEPADGGKLRITSIGHDPWTFKPLTGTVRLRRDDAASLAVTALDANGAPVARAGAANEIKLRAETLYYLITLE